MGGDACPACISEFIKGKIEKELAKEDQEPVNCSRCTFYKLAEDGPGYLPVGWKLIGGKPKCNQCKRVCLKCDGSGKARFFGKCNECGGARQLPEYRTYTD